MTPRKLTTPGFALGSVLLSVVFLGCAPKQVNLPTAAPNPTLRALVIDQAVQESSINFERATLVAEQEQIGVISRSSRWFVGRYNRASCDCPPYEILLGSTWTRFYTKTVPGQTPQTDDLFLIKGFTQDTNNRALNDNVYDSLEVEQILTDPIGSVPDALAKINTLPKNNK